MYLTLDVLVLVPWSHASNIGLGIRMGRQFACLLVPNLVTLPYLYMYLKVLHVHTLQSSTNNIIRNH